MIRGLYRFCAAAACALFLWNAPGAGAQTQEFGRWRKIETQDFIVYSDGREQDLRNAVADLEAYDELLRWLTQAPEVIHGAKLEIYLFRSRGSFLQAAPGASDDIAGFYSATTEITGAYAIFDDSGGFAQEILFHEYAHHFMFRYFAEAYPAWYTEGFAEFASTARITDDRVEVGGALNMRGDWLWDVRWLPLADMIARPSTADLSTVQSQRFYAQSWAIIHYCFTHEEAQAALGRYLAAVRTGAEPVPAFTQAFGVSPEEFQRTLQRYVRGQINFIRMTRRATDQHIYTVTRLPRSADVLLPLEIQLRNPLDPAEAPAVVADVRREAARWPNEIYAQSVAARAEVEIGEYARAREILAPLLAAHPRDADLLYLQGFTYFFQAVGPHADASAAPALMAEARRAFAQSSRIDPNSVPTLARYAMTFEQSSDNDNALTVLLHAHTLAPQIGEISLEAAIRLMMRRRFDDASVLLRPMAYDPHGGARARFALRMLDLARQGIVPDADALKDQDKSDDDGEDGDDDVSAPLLRALP